MVRWMSILVCVGATLSTAVFGVAAYRANEDRWHQGPTVFTFSSTHGLHEMDVLLLGAAVTSAVIALIAALIARR